jgi:hypothetical protein
MCSIQKDVRGACEVALASGIHSFFPNHQHRSLSMKEQKTSLENLANPASP